MDQDEAYGRIEDPQQISYPVAFDFTATLLNTNKGMMSSALQGLGAALANPLMLQMGIVTPEQIYNWAKDLVQSMQLDPGRYLVKPKGTPEGPRHTAEEAILMIIEGRLPEVAPLEDPQQHLATLQKEMQSDNFGHLSAESVVLFKQYLMGVVQLVQSTMQQQQMMQNAQKFSQMMGQQGGGGQQGGAGQVPPMQTNAPTQAEIAGGSKAHAGPTG